MVKKAEVQEITKTSSSNNFAQVINACEMANGGGSKLVIRNELRTMNADSLMLLREAMNPFRVFGVRKFDQPTQFAEVDPASVDFVMETLDALHNRDLTGNAARDAVTLMLSKFTAETASFVERIIDKNPRAGFSADTANQVIIAMNMDGDFEANLKIVNKILKDNSLEYFKTNPGYPFLIPSFEVQLADKCENEDDFEALVFPCQADIKYDGERNVAIVSDKAVSYHSRSGNIAHHLAGLFDEELDAIKNHIAKVGFPSHWNAEGSEFILDGERFGKDFTQTMNAKKKNDVEAKNSLCFRGFFLMPLSHWKAQKTNITMLEARAYLRNILEECKCEKIILSDGKEVDSLQEMREYCNEAIDVHKMEGLILKQFGDVYKWERNTSWMKIKRFHDIDMVVVGWYMGREKSRLASTVGGLILEGRDEKGMKFRVRCGSGFSDKLRNEILENPDAFINRTAVISYQEITQAKDMEGTDIYCLRFPTLNRFRDDKKVDRLENN